MRPAFLPAVALALAGCAQAPVAVSTEAPKHPPIKAYAANPFVPVNLYVNANEHLHGQQAVLVDYAAQHLADSQAFVRVARGVQRWPITIQASYRIEPRSEPWRRVLGVLTLGLVPVRVVKVHRLSAEVFEEPESVAVLQLEVTRADRVSLYDLADPNRDERAAVDELLERLMAEVATRRLVPRWSEFKPDPKPKQPKDKPPKPPGRET